MNFELKGMRLTAQGKDSMHTFIYVATILDDMEKRLIYEELLDEYNRLLAENRLLHEEMDKLKALLNDRNSVTAPPIVKSYLSLEEKVDVFRNLFKGRGTCLRGDGTAGPPGNPATSLYAGTNGTGSCATRKDTDVRNAPIGCSKHWSMRIYTGILRGKVRTDRM